MTPKFRIYDNEEEKYINSPRFLLSEDGRLLETFNATWHEIGERYVVEFYSGKEDKLGIDICECDVCETVFYNHSSKNSKLNQAVCFSDGSFNVKSDDIEFLDTRRHVPLSWCDEIKIIGTIHDEKYKGL